VCVFVSAVAFVPSRCLATVQGYTFRHRLLVGIYEVRRLEGFIPSFIKAGSAIQNCREDTRGHRQHDDCIRLPLFFQRKESRLKVNLTRDRMGWYGLDLAQDRGQWRALVNTVMNLRVP
jgi:hypothetical protein